MPNSVLPAIVVFGTSSKMDQEEFERLFDRFIESGGAGNDRKEFQDYLDEIVEQEYFPGPLGEAQIEVGSTSVLALPITKITPEGIAELRNKPFPWYGIKYQNSKEYILLMQFGKRELVVADGDDLKEYMQGDQVSTHHIKLPNNLEIRSLKRI